MIKKIKEAYEEHYKELGKDIYEHQQRYEDLDVSLANADLETIQDELYYVNSWWNVEDFDERKLRQTIKNAINAANNVKLYDGYIELSDNHTLFNISADISNEEYMECVNDAASEFEYITGVELYFLGRSGRHVCVENTYENALKYNELCKIQNELETKMIDYINNNTEWNGFDY